MTEQRNRGSAGTRPALVIDGEAVVIARHARARTTEEAAAARTAEPKPATASSARSAFGRARPQPARRRKPATPDLIFQSAPKQRFAMPSGERASVLPRAAWIAGLMTLAALLPLAALSVFHASGTADTIATAAPSTAPATDQPVRILYGTPPVQATRIASAGESRPATLPGRLGGVYPVSAGVHPAGVARLQAARNIPDMKAVVRRTP